MAEPSVGRVAVKEAALPRRIHGTHLPPEAYTGRHRADQDTRWDEPALERVLARLNAWEPDGTAR